MAYNHIFTNIFRELKSRITTAQDGGDLEELKKLVIGEPEQTFEKKDLPRIYMPFDGLLESFEAQKNEKRSAELTIGMVVIYPVDSTKDNIYYDDSSTPYTGYIPFIERLLDTICSDTSGNINMRLNAVARKSIEITADKAIKQKDSIYQQFSVVVRSKDFTINERYEAS